jgi:K+-transporting ATPase ATPase C chain
MWSECSKALRVMFVLTILTGLAYPVLVTVVAQALFPAKAHGSLVLDDGRVVGSALIGQNFTRPDYFHPRPSAAGAGGYDATASAGSNLGPTSRELVDRVRASIARYRQENAGYEGPVPADAVTASASGLDPDISPANAQIQAGRVARVRGVPLSRMMALVRGRIEPSWLGFIGEPRVNVLELNLDLDREFGRPGTESRGKGR